MQEIDTRLETHLFNSQNTALAFSDQELEWIKNNNSVTVIGDSNWFPFEGVDKEGNYDGIVADVLNLISQKSGLIFHVSETAT